jgi:hypothetical protein
MNRFLAALLAATLLAGCASPARDDWRYSDVRAAVDRYRTEQAPASTLPHRLRSIRVDGADHLTVYLADSPGLSGSGCELSLTRSPSGTWAVTGSRFFTY